jgi:four helix bundle protein
MKESVIATKSFLFAINVVELYKTIIPREKEFAMIKQLLRSGKSIGANIAEAAGSISKREFIAKMQISYKEAHESLFG